ncbi:hypothetical protein [Galbibacter mesophilus]|uniref:hypothetical protein n=1 Tax=Galbibacter mesophilus TaxID=379069 RepID=UPI00191E251D|nr:hypothetical protein [Galbibacter mesophilus]MCM5664014.1 hypothetical protein [Galbibacter mesophilus]
METKVRKVLEIPARKTGKVAKPTEKPVENSFLLIINLWIFRYVYNREQFAKE